MICVPRADFVIVGVGRLLLDLAQLLAVERVLPRADPLVEAARHGQPAHGTSDDHVPAQRIPTGRYSGSGTGGE